MFGDWSDRAVAAAVLRPGYPLSSILWHSRLTNIPVLIYLVMARLPPSISREKPLHWVASAKKDYLLFPPAVQDDMGYALGLAQLGAKHPNAKPWKGEGPGVFEIVEDQRGDTYRAVYTVRFAKVVYVLHAFQKKSKTGIKTPQTDVKLIAERFKRAQAD